MRRRMLISFLLTLVLAFPCYALSIGGVEPPDRLKAGKTELLLNGAGIRSKAFLKLYVGSLYLTKRQSSHTAIIGADEAMAIRINIISSIITSDMFIENTKAGFTRATNGNTAPLQSRIDKLLAAFKDKIKKGDVFDLIYIPGTGTQIYRNGVLQNTVEGADFKKALFGVWLIDKPAHGCEPLRKGMLGLS